MTMLTDLAERLKTARGKQTQAQIAKQLGVSVRTYQDWEYGRAFPQTRHRDKVAALLKEAA